MSEQFYKKVINKLQHYMLISLYAINQTLLTLSTTNILLNNQQKLKEFKLITLQPIQNKLRSDNNWKMTLMQIFTINLQHEIYIYNSSNSQTNSKAIILYFMEQPRSQKCEVCFTTPHCLNPYQKIIKCIVCKRKAHLYCYSPDFKSSNFTCDACTYKYKENCIICNNSGLLKKFSSGYAHPVCLFFHQAIIVADYKELKFANIQVLKPGKKLKCLECGNSTGGVLRCNSKKCPCSSHLYCAMKSSNIVESTGWRVCLQPQDAQKSLKEIIENRLLRTLRSQNKFIAGQLDIKKSLKTLQVPLMIYCEQHASAVVECFCRQYNEQKMDWVFCQSCCRWIHFDCLKMNPQKIESNDFICPQCRSWQQWVKERSPYLPQRLPKLHLYDYVYINKLLERVGSKASFKLIQLAQRIPLLPGLIYGSIFFKQELIKKLKQRINLPVLRCALEDRKCWKKILCEHRNQFEIVLWITNDEFVGSTHGQNLPHQLEESVDEQYVEDMINAIQQYQKKYFPNSSNPLLIEKKRINMVKQELQQQKFSSKSPLSKSSYSPSNSFSITAKKQVPHTQPKKQILDYQALNEFLQNFHLKYNVKAGFPIDYVQMFQEMFKIYKQPEILALLMEQPLNIWINTLLLQTPRHAAVYASNIGKMHLIKNQMIQLRKLNNQKKTPQSHKALQQTIGEWQKIKDKMYFQKQGIDIQQFSLQETENLEFKEPVRKIFSFDFEMNTAEQQSLDSDKLGLMINQKQLERILSIKQENVQCDVNLQLFSHVYHQIKRLKLNSQSKKLVTKQLLNLSRQNFKAQNIKHSLEQYMLLYSNTECLIKELKIYQEQNNQTCYFQLLSNYRKADQNFLKKPQNLISIVAFLVKIQKVRMDMFSHSIQSTIFHLVKSLVQHFRQANITEYQQLSVLNYWPKMLRIQLPSQLQKQIQLDHTINRKYMFSEALFQIPQNIQQLKHHLLEDLAKFTQIKLPFRVRQVKNVLNWIVNYQKILKIIPLKCILSLQIASDTELIYRPKIEEMQSLDQMLTCIKFPDGKFRQKFAELTNIGRQMMMRFERITAACNWEFSYETHHENISNNKIELYQLEEFIAKAKRLPICLQVEAKDCEIIIDRFHKNEAQASILLKEIAKQSHNLMDKQLQKKVMQIINHMGATPIKSNYTEKFLQIIQNLQSPDKFQQAIQKSYIEITSSPNRFTYKQVIWMINYIQMYYQGKLDKNKLLTSLKNYKIVIDQCLSEYRDVLQKYQTKNNLGTDVEIKKVEFMAKKYKKSSIRHLTLADICKQFMQYQELVLLYSHYENDSLPIEAKDLQEMNEIILSIHSLHRFFYDQKVAKLKQTVELLIQTKTALI